MATLNLGRIKPVFRGAYAGGTAYVVDDIVTSVDESFICIQAGTGNATSNASYWTKLAAKGTDGTDVGTTITTQGDILYRDGSGLQRLAKGTAGQVLQINTGATAPEWADSTGGVISTGGFSAGQNIFTHEWTNQTSTSTQWSSTSLITGSEWDLGSSLTANKTCIFTYSVTAYEQDWNHTFLRAEYSVDDGANYVQFNSTEDVHDAWFKPPSGTGSDLQSVRTRTYLQAFTSGQTPRFRLRGGRYGSSNNLKVNYDKGNDGTVKSYMTAWFI